MGLRSMRYFSIPKHDTNNMSKWESNLAKV